MMVHAKKVSKLLVGNAYSSYCDGPMFEFSPIWIGWKMCPSNACDTMNDRYAVAAKIAAYLNPAPKFPSEIFPMKNPDIQH